MLNIFKTGDSGTSWVAYFVCIRLFGSESTRLCRRNVSYFNKLEHFGLSTTGQLTETCKSFAEMANTSTTFNSATNLLY